MKDHRTYQENSKAPTSSSVGLIEDETKDSQIDRCQGYQEIELSIVQCLPLGLDLL